MSGLTPISAAAMAGLGSSGIFFDEGAYLGIVGYIHGLTKPEAFHCDVRFSVDGSTYRSDASGYSYSGEFWDGSSSGTLNNNTSSWRIINAQGTNGLECTSAIFNVWDNGVYGITGDAISTGLDATGSSRTTVSGCDLAVAGPLRGVQIFGLGGGGNFSTGRIEWFGWVAA